MGSNGRIGAALVAFAIALLIVGRVAKLQEVAAGGAAPTDARAAEGDAPLPVARVRGRVLLEPPPSADGDEQAPEDMELVPPREGTCTAIAWRDGERVGGPATCAGDGHFEVELQPGVHGPVTFEMLVPERLRAVVQVDVPEGGVGRLPTVALGFAVPVSGQVVDVRGRPIPGAQLEAMPSPSLDEPEPWRAEADAQGRFAMDTLPPGPLDLRGSKPGYTPSVVQAVAPQDDVLVVLEGVMDLRGEVVGPPELLSQAIVRVEGSGIWPAIEEPLDEAGKFAFARVPDGIYGLEAIVVGDDDEPEYASIPLENVTPDLYGTLALTRAFRVPVRVVDPDRAALADARVTMGYASIGLLQRMAITDASGRARVGPVVPGPYVIQADAEGFLPAEPVEIDVPPDGVVEEQTLVLARPAKIEGVVLDDAGHPVPGAIVMVESDELFTAGAGIVRARMFDAALATSGSLGVTTGPVPEIPLFPDETEGTELGAVTDTDGSFVLEMLVPGTYRLRARHGQHAASGIVTLKLKSGEIRAGVTLRLRPGQPLTGRILDGNRRPVAHARVELDDGMIVLTDRRGVFDAGYRRGQVELIVHAPGMIPRRIETRVDDEPVDLELAVAPADGVLVGRVRDENLQPVEDVRVTLRPRDGLSPTAMAWTDARGEFELRELTPGDADVELDHPGYQPLQVRAIVAAEPGGDPVEVELRAGWTVEVTVRAKGTGAPVEGASVAVPGGLARTTDAQGHAVLSRIGGGTARIEVAADGWVGARVDVQREAGARSEIVVELSEGGAIEGTVGDDLGEPVARARVVLRTPSGEVLGETSTDRAGAWRFAGVPEGPVVVDAEPPSRVGAELAPVRVESDVLRGRVTREVHVRFDRR